MKRETDAFGHLSDVLSTLERRERLEQSIAGGVLVGV
jgi:hypothetical protein